jgi:hypothetical protein
MKWFRRRVHEYPLDHDAVEDAKDEADDEYDDEGEKISWQDDA